jgi:hypothetical protein
MMQMTNNEKGKYYEDIVYLIEKSINSNAHVEWNVELPILSSKIGATAQCDLIIKTGTKERETLTLAEIQNRGSRVEPNDFRGWIKKLEDVGAQHLICVSKNDFPESIKEQALLSGNKVKLIILKEIPDELIPFNVEFIHEEFTSIEFLKRGVIYSESLLNNLKIEENILMDLLENLHMRPNDPIFSWDKKNQISLMNLCMEQTQENNSEKGTSHFVTDINKSPEFFIFIDGKYLKLGYELIYKWEKKVLILPPTIFSYTQLGNGILSWFVEAEIETSTGKISYKIPIRRTKEGISFDSKINVSPNTNLFFKVSVSP